MEWITQFFGRFHPVLVHFPIGILILAFLFECLSRFKSYRKIRVAIPPSLLIGALFAIASAFSGYFLSQEGGYDDELLERHETLGIITAIFSALAFFLYVRARKFFQDKSRRKTFHLIIFFPLIILVSLTGHFGGSITHGEDYLFEIVSSSGLAVDPSVKLGGIANVDTAIFYADVIQPILEARCYSCHSSSKQKGELRLDGASYIERGGEDGVIVDAGRADSSELFKRLMLSLEDEDHMPPNEKPQPSSSEIALIQAWINEGANFQMKVSECTNTEKIRGYFQSVVEQSHKVKLIPDEEVEAPDEKAIARLRELGILVIPVSRESNYLSVSFINKRSVSADVINAIIPLKRQVVWLDLARTSVSDSSMAGIGQLTALRQLSLAFTAVSDEGLRAVPALSNLSYLNLVGTRITDEGLAQLANLKNLENLFIYQTAVTDTGIKNYQTAAPRVAIDSGGYRLPKMITDSIVTKFTP